MGRSRRLRWGDRAPRQMLTFFKNGYWNAADACSMPKLSQHDKKWAPGWMNPGARHRVSGPQFMLAAPAAERPEKLESLSDPVRGVPPIDGPVAVMVSSGSRCISGRAAARIRRV